MITSVRSVASSDWSDHSGLTTASATKNILKSKKAAPKATTTTTVLYVHFWNDCIIALEGSGAKIVIIAQWFKFV